MVDLEPLDDDDLRPACARSSSGTTTCTGSPVAEPDPGRLGGRVVPLPQGDAEGLPAGAGRDGARPRRDGLSEDETMVQGDGGRPMGEADRVPEVGAGDADPPAGAGAAPGLAGGLRAVPGRDGPDPGRAVHGLRHPVLQQRLPARQPHPGLERPRLPGPLARRHRAAARHEQLPRVHRPAVPGAVRGGLRARHQRRPGHHQAGRGRDHRPGLGRGLGHAAAAVGADRQAGGGDRLRARPAWPPPSS